MARKKWRLLMLPTFTYKSCPSQVAAYREVVRLRELRQLGMSRVANVVIQVDEGQGWQVYERLPF